MTYRFISSLDALNNIFSSAYRVYFRMQFFLLRKTRLEKIILGLFFAGLVGCDQTEFSIDDAWIPASPPNVTALAGYFSATNNTDKPLVVVGATSHHFGSIDMHRTEYNQELKVYQMLPLKQRIVNPGEMISFKPGGQHLMFHKPINPLSNGQKVIVKLKFENAPAYSVEFLVRQSQFTY